MKKIAHLLMGRLTIVGVSILLQICWLFLVLCDIRQTKTCCRDN